MSACFNLFHLRIASMRLATFSGILAVATALQNLPDPVKDFCRRHQHQTCVIDSKLYIDGGLVNYGGGVTSQTVTEKSRLTRTVLGILADLRRHLVDMGRSVELHNGLPYTIQQLDQGTFASASTAMLSYLHL
jgi:hypothetical protein